MTKPFTVKYLIKKTEDLFFIFKTPCDAVITDIRVNEYGKWIELNLGGRVGVINIGENKVPKNSDEFLCSLCDTKSIQIKELKEELQVWKDTAESLECQLAHKIDEVLSDD